MIFSNNHVINSFSNQMFSTNKFMYVFIIDIKSPQMIHKLFSNSPISPLNAMKALIKNLYLEIILDIFHTSKLILFLKNFQNSVVIVVLH